MKRGLSCLAAVVMLCIVPASFAAPGDYFAIHIVDDQTGRGVPLVRLQTTSKIRYFTDSNGYVAFFEPGLMDQDVYFDIASWGYQAPKIGFGWQGATLHTTPGKEAEVKIHRNNIAEHCIDSPARGSTATRCCWAKLRQLPRGF